MPASRINQSSSRLLRTTDDSRPLFKDLTDLFAALIVSLLPLEAHRVRFTKVEHSFHHDNAIRNLGNLKLLQTNRMPDPADPSRTVVSTSTTIFSMSKDMARSLCQRFVDAHFIESADGKKEPTFHIKPVWKLTSKGITVLNWFCSANGIEDDQVMNLVNTVSTPLITLERHPKTDKLLLDQGTIELIFCRLSGAGRRGNRALVNSSDSNPRDYKIVVGTERKINGRPYYDVFSGQNVAEWLMDFTTTMDLQEAVNVASLFVQYNLMTLVVRDRAYVSQFPECEFFQPSNNAVYTLSQHGHDLVENNGSGRTSSEGMGDGSSQHSTNSSDSNSQRLDKILADPTLRLLFRENLQETLCEENLSFHQEVCEFIQQSKAVPRTPDKIDAAAVSNAKELLSQSYILFNTFLAPGSPRELNLNHQLRKSLADRMTNAQSRDTTIADTLQEVTSLFESAQTAVFKLMATDSVPKFINNPKLEYRLVQAGIRS